MNPIRAVIIDDEAGAINTLTGMLSAFCPEVQVVCAASNEYEAFSAIVQKKPEIIYLDIQMAPTTNGLDIIGRFQGRSFDVIITTAYPEYAIQSVNQLQPMGYLVKPINLQELIEVTNKTIDKIRNQEKVVLENDEHRIIIAANKDQMIAVLPSNILYCRVDDQILRVFYYENGMLNKTITHRTMKSFETTLPDYFFRIHHKTLVNLKGVVSFNSIGRRGTIKLIDDTELEISVQKMASFSQRFKAFVRAGE